MVIVLAQVQARPETLPELLAASHQHVARSRQEPGCLEHGVYQEPGHPERLIFVEKWQDLATLKTHIELPASQTFGRLLRQGAAAPINLEIYQSQPATLPRP